METLAPHPIGSQASVTSFPLERPSSSVRRRDLTTGGVLPYFITGQENRLIAFVAQSNSSIFELGNPLLLVGPPGCGKTVIATHLAARQATLVPIDQEPAPVLFYTAVDFARQYAEAVAANDLMPLRQELDQAPILVVDDLHLISDKPAAQDELARRIDSRTERQAATIVTCTRLPPEVRGIRPLLSSRVLPGLTITMAMPGQAARRQLIHELALRLELELDPPLLEMLDERLDAKMPARSLEAALKQVSLWCKMNDCAPTADAVEAAVEVVGPSEEVSLATIAGAVATHYQMKLSDLRSSSRKQSLVRARSLAMLISRRMTNKSMHQIGDYFGGRDHTTVLHAIRKTESLLGQDNDLRQAADEVQSKLG